MALWAGVVSPSFAQSQTIHYAPPYFYQATDANNNPIIYVFSDVDDAIASAKTYLVDEYPATIPADCQAESTYLKDATSASQGYLVKIDYAPSTNPNVGCPSNTVTIQLSAYKGDPLKGNGNDCNGGNGVQNGDGRILCYGTTKLLDPIDAATGNKYEQVTDYSGSASLSFMRFYNSSTAIQTTALGPQWRHSFDRTLSFLTTFPDGTGSAYIQMNRPDGSGVKFNASSGAWVADADVADTLTQQSDGSYIAFIAGPDQFEHYSSSGQLQSITDKSGMVTSLSYNSSGQLQTVTDPNGRTLTFTYDGSGHLHTVTQPDGGTLTYSYSNGLLASVQYPDSSTRQYIYNESSLTSGASLPDAMTGEIDEAGVRFESTGYNASGLAISTSQAGGANAASMSGVNSTSISATVTLPLGKTITIGSKDDGFGSLKLAHSSVSCNTDLCKQPWLTRTYDANGYPATATDFNANQTKYTYNSAGLETQRIEAVGFTDPSIPFQRTINTTWDSVLRNPLTKTTLDYAGNTVTQEAWAYNTRGQVLAHCQIDPAVSGASGYACGSATNAPAGVRQWTYTYCDAVDTTKCPVVGLELTADGPRTDLADITTFSYYMADSATAHHGDLNSVTDALGHTTTYLSYDGAGRVLSQQDANGVVTTFTYYPRGWLKTRSVGGATTSFTYTAYGALKTVTDPDSVTITYGYDGAHRLTDITDALGNHVHYTLDAAGDRTSENTYATGSTTASRTLTRQFNTLGQLTKIIDGVNHTVFDASGTGAGGNPTGYDPQGNLQFTQDAFGKQTLNQYDALNRPWQVMDDYSGLSSATQFTTTITLRDALDRLVTVTDPSQHATTYTYDGLSNQTSTKSPDAGTISSTFDAAGNVVTQTDARGIVATRTYDAVSRLTSTSYSDNAQTSDNATYTYDEANSTTGCATSYPLGRLTRMVESAVTTVYCYDARGNVTRKQQITSAGTDNTAYSYTSANRLSGITYPSGTQASYAFDADGRIQSITLTPPGGSASLAVSNITYLPLGPISGYTLGNGQTVTRAYDANYALTDLTSPALNLHFSRDLMGNINAEGSAPGASPAAESYTYDPLYRLTGITQGSTNIETLTYNQTGDRTSKTGGGLATGTYTYAFSPTPSHRLAYIGSAARTYDANGNMTGNSSGGQTWGYGYNGRNRLTVVQVGGSTVGTYAYNALGQRIQKVATTPVAITQRFGYDEQNHLIGEYAIGNNRDTIWADDLPIATVDSGGSSSVVAYITADHLDTPRAVSDVSGNLLWQWSWLGNPFGEVAPTSSTGYTLNLRYPGQYLDAESGMAHNGYRDYDATVGRFIQSDPSGLKGGISTYAYVNSNPFSLVDKSGLQAYYPPQWGGISPGPYALIPTQVCPLKYGTSDSPNASRLYNPQLAYNMGMMGQVGGAISIAGAFAVTANTIGFPETELSESALLFEFGETGEAAMGSEGVNFMKLLDGFAGEPGGSWATIGLAGAPYGFIPGAIVGFMITTPMAPPDEVRQVQAGTLPHN